MMPKDRTVTTGRGHMRRPRCGASGKMMMMVVEMQFIIISIFLLFPRKLLPRMQRRGGEIEVMMLRRVRHPLVVRRETLHPWLTSRERMKNSLIDFEDRWHQITGRRRVMVMMVVEVIVLIFWAMELEAWPWVLRGDNAGIAIGSRKRNTRINTRRANANVVAYKRRATKPATIHREGWHTTEWRWGMMVVMMVMLVVIASPRRRGAIQKKTHSTLPIDSKARPLVSNT